MIAARSRGLGVGGGDSSRAPRRRGTASESATLNVATASRAVAISHYKELR